MGLGVVNFLAIISLYVVNFYVSEHMRGPDCSNPPVPSIDRQARLKRGSELSSHVFSTDDRSSIVLAPTPQYDLLELVPVVAVNGQLRIPVFGHE